jgi:hypothetical protein
MIWVDEAGGLRVGGASGFRFFPGKGQGGGCVNENMNGNCNKDAGRPTENGAWIPPHGDHVAIVIKVGYGVGGSVTLEWTRVSRGVGKERGWHESATESGRFFRVAARWWGLMYDIFPDADEVEVEGRRRRKSGKMEEKQAIGIAPKRPTILRASLVQPQSSDKKKGVQKIFLLPVHQVTDNIYKIIVF